MEIRILFVFSRWRLSTILVLLIPKISMAGQVRMSQMYHHAKFSQIGQTVADIWRFIDFFRWRSSAILDFQIWDLFTKSSKLTSWTGQWISLSSSTVRTRGAYALPHTPIWWGGGSPLSPRTPPHFGPLGLKFRPFGPRCVVPKFPTPPENKS